MPAYNTIAPPAMYPGDSYTVLAAEATIGITSSQQLYLTPDLGTGETSCIVEGFFSGDPGAFQVNVQFAATDLEAAYITPDLGGAIVSTTGTPNWRFSYQYDPCLGPFVRVNKGSIANAVNLTVKVTR